MLLRDWLRRTLRLVPPEFYEQFYEQVVAHGRALALGSDAVVARLAAIDRRLDGVERGLTATPARVPESLAAAVVQAVDLSPIEDRLRGLEITLREVVPPPEFYEEMERALARQADRLATLGTRLEVLMARPPLIAHAPLSPSSAQPAPLPEPPLVVPLDCGHAHHSYATQRDGTTQCTDCYEAAMALQGATAP